MAGLAAKNPCTLCYDCNGCTEYAESWRLAFLAKCSARRLCAGESSVYYNPNNNLTLLILLTLILFEHSAKNFYHCKFHFHFPPSTSID